MENDSRYLVPDTVTIRLFKDIYNKFVRDLLTKQGFDNLIVNPDFSYYFKKEKGLVRMFGWNVLTNTGQVAEGVPVYDDEKRCSKVTLKKDEVIEQNISSRLLHDSAYTVVFLVSGDVTLKVSGDDKDIFQMEHLAFTAAHTMIDKLESKIIKGELEKSVLRFKTNIDSFSENIKVQIISNKDDNEVELYKVILYRGLAEFTDIPQIHNFLHSLKYENNCWMITQDFDTYEPINRTLNKIDTKFVLDEHSYTTPGKFEICEGGELIVEKDAIMCVI